MPLYRMLNEELLPTGHLYLHVHTPIRNPSYSYACSHQSKVAPTCQLHQRSQLFHQWLLLKCKRLASGVVASANPVSVAVFYLYFRLRWYFQATRSKVFSYHRRLGGPTCKSLTLFDRGETQSRDTEQQRLVV